VSRRIEIDTPSGIGLKTNVTQADSHRTGRRRVLNLSDMQVCFRLSSNDQQRDETEEKGNAKNEIAISDSQYEFVAAVDQHNNQQTTQFQPQ
jgi:hypothetical protein